MTKRIFIVGTPRSGTTLLQSLLACSPDVVSFPETHFFDRSVRKVAGFPVVYRSAKAILSDFLHGTEGLNLPYPALLHGGILASLFDRVPLRHASILIAYLDDLSRNIGSETWIEKTPRHLDHIRLISAACGTDAPHFVHIVRKRSSNVRSLVVAAPQWGEAMSHRRACAQWRADLLTHSGFAASKNHHFIFYEDLTNTPDPIVCALSAKLGVRLTGEMLAERGKVASVIVNSWETWKVNNLSTRILSPDETIWEPDYDTEIAGALRKIEAVKVGAGDAAP